MSVNLLNRLGFSAEFDCSARQFNYPTWAEVRGEKWQKKIEDENGQPGIWRSLMFAPSYKTWDGKDESSPDFTKLGLKGTAYWGFRNYRMVCPTNAEFGDNVRPDITVIPARMFAAEFARTEGHTHSSGLPEIYETILGRVGYLLFKPSKQKPNEIEDAMLVVSQPGDHVLFPPGYAHVTINLDRAQTAIVTDLVSTEARPSFDEIRKRSGGSHYITLNEGNFTPTIKPNLRYDKVPELRIVKPAEELVLPTGKVLKKDEPMFSVHASGSSGPFMFLNDPNQRRHEEMFQRAFVPFS